MPIQEHASEQRGTKCANAWRPTLPHPTQEIEAQLRANFLVQPLWKGRRKPSTHADQPLMHEIDGCKFEMLRNFQPSFKQTNNPGFVQVLNLVACSWFEPTTIGWRKLCPSQGRWKCLATTMWTPSCKCQEHPRAMIRLAVCVNTL